LNPSFSGYINGYENIQIDSNSLKASDIKLASILSILKCGQKLLPSGYLLDKDITLFKKKYIIDKQHEIKFKHTNELVVDILKNGEKRVYTNLEFCRDLFLFQCGLGTRFGDTIKLKIEHFDFKNKEFKIYMEKTNRTVRVPINEMTEKIFRKYSKDKSKDDFIFPKTISGNFYPNQKINTHLKTIAQLAKINRLIHRPLRSGKTIIKKTENSKQLWEVITTHVGRRTFIKEGIINKIEPYVIMSLVGHKSLRVFERYFSMNDEDRKISSSLFSFVSENRIPINSKSNYIEVEKKLKNLKTLLTKKIISQKVYDINEKEILSTL
jgi:hypothetical protein